MEEIFVLDIYTKLCEILQTIATIHNINYQELHDIYLIDLYNQLNIDLNQS